MVNTAVYILLTLSSLGSYCKDWKEKNINQYSESDFDLLYDQWEENDDEKIPNDELPYGHPDRPDYSNIKMEDFDFKDPSSVKKFSNMKKNIFVIATLTGNPSREETEEISGLWMQGLFNNHIDLQRFILEDDQVMFSSMVTKTPKSFWNFMHIFSARRNCL